MLHGKHDEDSTGSFKSSEGSGSVGILGMSKTCQMNEIQREEIRMRSHFLLRLVQVCVLCAAISATAFAQYGGGSTGTGSGTTSSTYTSNGGYSNTGKAIGIGVGAAAGVAAIALYVHHRHKVAAANALSAGKTQTTHNLIRVPGERDHQLSSKTAKDSDRDMGEQAELFGQKANQSEAGSTPRGRDLLKDYGTASSPSALNSPSGSR
jgi:hypothetical protein